MQRFLNVRMDMGSLRQSVENTLIISINARMIENVAEEGEHLFRSLSDLVLYATGAAACSTADLMLVLDAINNSMDNIEKLLNRV